MHVSNVAVDGLHQDATRALVRGGGRSGVRSKGESRRAGGGGGGIVLSSSIWCPHNSPVCCPVPTQQLRSGGSPGLS